MNVRVLPQEILRNSDNRRLRGRNPEVAEESRSDPLVHQNPPVLRIVEKLHNVEVRVTGFDQMRLRSAAHLADQAAGVDWHAGSIRVAQRLYDGRKRNEPRTAPLTQDEVALELMKFIAGTTGMGKTSAGAGFAGKPPKTPEEQVDALLQLFERCRAVVKKTD